MGFNFLPNFAEIIIAVILFVCILLPKRSISGGVEKIETDNNKEMDSFRVVKFLDLIQTIRDVKVNEVTAFDYFGKIGDNLSDNIRDWLPNKIENEKATDVCNSIAKFIEAAMKQPEADGKPYGWFTIRLTKPTDEFDTPRWHRDGNFFGATHKIAATIQGPGTLLIGEQEALEIVTDPKYMNVYPFGPEGLEMRTEIASRMSKFDPVQLQPGEMVVFRVGNRNNSAVHSEPPMHTDRIFVSVLPGTEEQIRQLAANRNGEFIE
jgi:hypothetical protein